MLNGVSHLRRSASFNDKENYVREDVGLAVQILGDGRLGEREVEVSPELRHFRRVSEWMEKHWKVDPRRPAENKIEEYTLEGGLDYIYFAGQYQSAIGVIERSYNSEWSDVFAQTKLVPVMKQRGGDLILGEVSTVSDLTDEGLDAIRAGNFVYGSIYYVLGQTVRVEGGHSYFEGGDSYYAGCIFIGTPDVEDVRHLHESSVRDFRRKLLESSED